jgi:hypothetical protein
MAAMIGEGFRVVANAAIRHTMSKVAVGKWCVFSGVRFSIRHIFGVFVACFQRGLGVNWLEKLCTLVAQ